MNNTNFIIAKIIDIKHLSSGANHFEFNKKISLDSQNNLYVSNVYTEIYLKPNQDTIGRFPSLQYLIYTMLNTFVIIIPTIYGDFNYGVRMVEYPSKEELWNYLGNLQNPTLEEINLLQNLING